MAPRSQSMPINGALNRPRHLLGLPLMAWLCIAAGCGVLFMAGLHKTAIGLAPLVMLACWIIFRFHPKAPQLWLLALTQKSYYDPRKG